MVEDSAEFTAKDIAERICQVNKADLVILRLMFCFVELGSDR